MTINKIRKYGLIITIVGMAVIGLIFKKISYDLAYLAGSMASFICLLINEHFLMISESRNDLTKNIFNFIVRMFIYVVALSFSFKLVGIEAMIITFIGCLTIRIAIVVYGIKEVR